MGVKRNGAGGWGRDGNVEVFDVNLIYSPNIGPYYVRSPSRRIEVESDAKSDGAEPPRLRAKLMATVSASKVLRPRRDARDSRPV
ncbi:unnamed protein product, partial [Iphiclides podalirius]